MAAQATKAVVQATQSERLTCELKYEDRLEVGQPDEQIQADFLRSRGWDIRDVPKYVDMVEKIDRYLVINGVQYTVQIKGRDKHPEKKSEYVDLLADVFEPYCGYGHPLTTVGRDAVSKYDWYVCRIQNMLYMVRGPIMKNFVRTAVKEWTHSDQRRLVDGYLKKWVANLGTRSNGETDWTKSWNLFGGGGLIQQQALRCKENRNLMVRCTQDRKNHRPKLLIFVPPTMFSADELYIYQME